MRSLQPDVGLPVVVLDLFNDMDLRALAAGEPQRGGPQWKIRCATTACRSAGHVCRRIGAAGWSMDPDSRVAPSCSHDWRADAPCSAMHRTRWRGSRIRRGFFRCSIRWASRIPKPDWSRRPMYPAGWSNAAAARGEVMWQPARSQHRARPNRYFQKLESGRTLSVLFAADGREARVIGINEQWTAGIAQCAPFCYGGAVSGIALPAECAGADCDVAGSAGACDRTGRTERARFQSRCRHEPCVLEINPRPTATIDLYDADFESGLLALHLRACRGESPHIHRPDSLAGACDRLRPAGVARPGPNALAGVVHRYSRGRQPDFGWRADMQRARDGGLKRSGPQSGDGSP